MLLSTRYILDKCNGFCPEVALVLGSGLGDFAEEEIEVVSILPYEEIPEFVGSTVPGHAGRLILGYMSGCPIVCMQGRLHYYEGYSLQEITLPIRVLAELGVKSLVLTNAAGGIHPDFEPGTIMAITDHINFIGNPLIGENDGRLGPRYPDMTYAYNPAYIEKAKEAAQCLDVPLQEGVYVGTTGPSFETPAEIRAFRTLGADAVGMSTIPEVIVACHAGMKVLGLSLITNPAAGLSDGVLTEEDIYKTLSRVKGGIIALLKQLIPEIVSSDDSSQSCVTEGLG